MGFMTTDEEMDVLKRSIDGTEEIKGMLDYLTDRLDVLEDMVRDNEEAMSVIDDIRDTHTDIEEQCCKIVGADTD